MDYRNVLLIQTAFLGDVVLTTPMISALRAVLPEAKITVLVRPDAAMILRSDPRINAILPFDKKKTHRGPGGMTALAREIRGRAFDLLLCPHQSHRSGILSMFSGIPERIGYKSAGFSRFAYTERLVRPLDRPEIHRLLAFLSDALENRVPNARAIIAKTSDVPVLFETQESEAEASHLLSSLNIRNPALIAPSSVWPTKRWTAQGFADLAALIIERYQCDVLLVGSKEDGIIARDVVLALEETQPPRVRERVHEICGKTSLPGLYSLMKRSRFLVSNDSAPVHFACAARIPVVAVFGPTVPALGYAPIAPKSVVAEIDLPCRPCGTHGGKVCPLSHFHCMRHLTPEMVMGKLLEVSASA